MDYNTKDIININNRRGGGIVKKKTFILILALLVFSFGFAYAETEIIFEEAIVPNPVDNIIDDIKGSITDVEEILEILQEGSMKQNDIFNDVELEESINEVLDLEEYESMNRLETIYIKGKEKIQYIANIVEKQYNMKKQFIANTKEIYDLTYETQRNLRSLGLEMKDIIKDDNRTIDKEDYAEIRGSIDSLKDDIKANNYIMGNVARESRKYIKLVRNKEFINATKTFENILIFQEQQIHLLRIINENILELKFILENV